MSKSLPTRNYYGTTKWGQKVLRTFKGIDQWEHLENSFAFLWEVRLENEEYLKTLENYIDQHKDTYFLNNHHMDFVAMTTHEVLALDKFDREQNGIRRINFCKTPLPEVILQCRDPSDFWDFVNDFSEEFHRNCLWVSDHKEHKEEIKSLKQSINLL